MTCPRRTSCAATSTTTSPMEVAAGRLGGGPQRTDAGHELLRIERLDDVVVGTRLEAADHVGGIGASGEHDDRNTRFDRMRVQISMPSIPGSIRSRSTRSGRSSRHISTAAVPSAQNSGSKPSVRARRCRSSRRARCRHRQRGCGKSFGLIRPSGGPDAATAAGGAQEHSIRRVGVGIECRRGSARKGPRRRSDACSAVKTKRSSSVTWSTPRRSHGRTLRWRRPRRTPRRARAARSSS